MIPVTKSFLPPREEFDHFLDQLWESRYLTNRGPLVRGLEHQIQEKLESRDLILVNNGTIAIQVAIKAYGLTGEIITTPFSYVATTSSIVWESCKPVFVDINKDYLTIDEELIEAAISDKTSAILATHVYGNPCHIERISEIALKHNLKVIYDAAHCFGVTYQGESIFNYGHVSTCSFHATKIFHTGEGGAIFCDSEDYDNIYHHHNFGHKGPLQFVGLGINAKMSEFNGALGLSILPYFDNILASRLKVTRLYDELLKDLPITKPKVRQGTNQNYSYYPIIFSSEDVLLKAEQELLENEIVGRRYFYPGLNKLPYLPPNRLKVADHISSSVFCLPLYHDLDEQNVIKIANTLVSVFEN